MIFSENITIGIASGEDKEDAVRRDGIIFYLVRANANVDDEVGRGFNLTVTGFGNQRAGVGVGD